jgi:hypothetical protein
MMVCILLFYIWHAKVNLSLDQESLSGELGTVKSPMAPSKPNQFGDTWVAGSWKVTGKNHRVGSTSTDRGIFEDFLYLYRTWLTFIGSNPEAILIGDPLGGSNNPDGTRLDNSLADITVL